MSHYLVQFELSQVWIAAQLVNPNDRAAYHKEVNNKLGGTLIGGVNWICGTNRGFLIIDFPNLDTFHVYFQSDMAQSGIRILSSEPFVTFEENAALLKKHAEHLTHYKMPGEEV